MYLTQNAVLLADPVEETRGAGALEFEALPASVITGTVRVHFTAAVQQVWGCCTHTHTHTHTHTYTHTHTLTHIYTHTLSHTHTHTLSLTHTHTHTYTQTQIHTHTHTRLKEVQELAVEAAEPP